MKNSLIAFLTAIGITIFAFPLEVRAGSDSAMPEVAPNFGVGSESILALDAFAFVSYDEYANGPVRAADARRYCDQTCDLVGQVTLPTGALVTAVELDAYDGDYYGNVIAVFAMCPKGCLQCSDIQSVQTPFSEAPTVIQVKSAVSPNWLIENQYNTYVVLIKISGGSSYTALRGFRIFYKLQISPDPAYASFSDVPVGYWAHQYVEALAASGITTGYGDGTFRPGEPVTRGQMAAFLSRALGLHWPN